MATTLLEADRQFGVMVRLAPEYPQQHRRGPQHQGRLSDAGGGNAYIPLSELATISLDTGASYIFPRAQPALRADQVQRARPRPRAARWRRRSSGSRSNVTLPTGYRIEWSGEFEWLQQAKQRLAIIVPISLAC